MNNFSRRHLLFTVMFFAAILAMAGLMPRIKAENSNKTIAFATEYRDMMSLVVQSGFSAEDVWHKINLRGVQGISVSEYTGEDLSLINPLNMKYGPAEQLGLKLQGVLPDRASILIDKNASHSALLYDYIKLKLPQTEKREIGNQIAIILPGNTAEFKISSFVPDFEALDFCLNNNISVLFRPGPCSPSNGNDTANAFDFLVRKYKQIRNVAPAGMIMAGYPDFKPFAAAMKKSGITFSQVEFVKQVGVTGFAEMMSPLVIPLHSVTKDEITSRNFSRTQLAERFVRAVHERSIRIIMMRPYDLQMGNRLEIFLEDLKITGDAIMSRGYTFGWPNHFNQWPAPIAGAIACGLSLIFCGWFYLARLKGINEAAVKPLEIISLLFLSLVISAGMWKIPILSRLFGGLCGAMIALEAAMTALEFYRKPFKGAFGGLFLVIAGGLSLASFYGTTFAALRLTPFSGVKLTLLLPPLLLLIHDLKRRIHPEALGMIVQRPVFWGELFLLGLMMAALLIVALRSDNISNVPAWEVAFRNFIERLLLVRPRTKEFLIGYPALVIYWYIVRKGWGIHYREVLRIASVFAFSSAVNTFCHFHTLLMLSVIRVFNGWWLGLLIGIVAVAAINFIGIPMWKKGLGEIFD